MRMDYESFEDVLTDGHSIVADVYTVIGGGQDPDGNPIPPAKHYYAQDAQADLQPQSGSERAAQSGSAYESTHRLFLGPTAEPIPAGARVDVKASAGGPVTRSFVVVFPANRGTHWEVDLKGA